MNPFNNGREGSMALPPDTSMGGVGEKPPTEGGGNPFVSSIYQP